MGEEFWKFPHTPHLVWLGLGVPREDKVLSPAAAAEFLSGPIVVEEKVDGANLGISRTAEGGWRAQNRGTELRMGESAPQWNPLWPWLAAHQQALAGALDGRQVVYGEWCFARHSVGYDGLPDWFLGFDYLDLAAGAFWSAERRNAWLHRLGLATVPEIARGQFSIQGLVGLMGASALGAHQMEGLYLRRELNDVLQARAKIVSPAFHQQIDAHWSAQTLWPNRLAQGTRRG